MSDEEGVAHHIEAANATKKHDVPAKLKEKFSKLQERRLEMSEKSKRKELKRLGKQTQAEPNKSHQSQNLQVNKEHKSTDMLKIKLVELRQYMADYDAKLLDDWPLKTELNAIESELNKAISVQDYDLVDELNRKLTEKTNEIRLKYAIDAQSYQEQKKKTEKPRLNWTFEPKKRWETKSNM
jgi:hypothetical protein